MRKPIFKHFEGLTLFIALFLLTALVVSAELKPAEFAELPENFKLNRDDIRIIALTSSNMPKGTPVLKGREIDSNDPKYSQLFQNLNTKPGFVQQIRDYQSIRASKGKSPKPLYIVLDEEGKLNISYNKTGHLMIVSDTNGKNQVKIETSGITFLSKSRVDELKQAPPSEWSMTTLTHEIGHAINAEMSGLKMTAMFPYSITQIILAKLRGVSNSHWKSKITSEEFALVEGFAEYCGDYYPGYNRSGSTAAFLTSNSEKRSKENLYSTEGFFAAILLNIANSGDINDGHRKIMTVMNKYKPTKCSTFFAYFAKEFPEDKATLTELLKRKTDGVIAALEPTPKEKLKIPSQQKRNLISAAAGIGGLALGLAIPGIGAATAPIIAAVAGSATYQALGDEGKITSLRDSIRRISLGRLSGAVIGGYFGTGLIPFLGPVGPIVGGLLGGLIGDWVGKKVVESVKSPDSYFYSTPGKLSISLKSLWNKIMRRNEPDDSSVPANNSVNILSNSVASPTGNEKVLDQQKRQQIISDYYKAVENKNQNKMQELGKILQN